MEEAFDFLMLALVGIAMTIGLTLVAIFGFTFAFLPISAASCEATAAAMQIEHKFGFWEGCVVKYHGEWIPLDKVNSVRISSDDAT